MRAFRVIMRAEVRLELTDSVGLAAAPRLADGPPRARVRKGSPIRGYKL